MSATHDFYLARADQSARDAESTMLGNVRERALRAEAAWRTMAERLLHGETMRDARVAERAARDDAALG